LKYDEIFQSFNIFDISKLEFDNSQELVSQVLKYTNFSVSPTQRLTIEFRLSDDSLNKAAHAVHSNLNRIKKVNEQLFTALFYLSDERERNLKYADHLILIHIKSKVLPTLLEEFPLDFIFNYIDFPSPIDTINQLMEKVNKRVNSLELPEKINIVIRQSFFYLLCSN
jgi:hypothetical protein